MKQIFILGSSNAFGVGGENGGWADKIKKHYQKKMYQESGLGEICQIYNFSKPGATVGFVLDTYPDQLKHYGIKGQKVAIVSVGGNNAKAENTKDNYVSSVEKFEQQMGQLFDKLNQDFDDVMALGYRFYDETKTLPKSNPMTGGCSFFWNERTQKFNSVLKDVCVQKNVEFIDFDMNEDEWVKTCLYADGLHPNDNGYDLMADAVVGALKKKEMF